MKEIDFIHYPWVVFKNTNSKLADALVAATRASATRALRESMLLRESIMLREFCGLMNTFTSVRTEDNELAKHCRNI